MKRIKTRFFLLSLVLSLSSLLVHVSAQTTWEKLYYDSDDQTSDLNLTNIDLKYDSINGEYVFLGLSHSANGGASVYELSNSGDLLFRNYYYSYGGGGQNLKFTRDGGIIISDIADDSGNAVKTLFKIDTSYNNVIWNYEYDFLVGLTECGLKETSDNKFLLATSRRTPSPFAALLKTDSIGNTNWVKQFYPMAGISKFITQTIDDNYLLCINSYMNGLGTILCKTDTTGNILWSKSYFRPDGYAYDMVEKPNGHLIVIGNTDVTAQSPNPVMFMSELDTLGRTLWCKTYGDSINNLIDHSTSTDLYIPMKIKSTVDGGYIITTGIKAPSQSTYDLVLLKTDSTGNIQWERRHGVDSPSALGINLIQTPDKGYFVVGSFGNNIGEGYYVLKTDSLGFTDCGGFSDSIAQKSINPTDSAITVTDSVIVINVYPATVHDTTATPPTVSDGCLLDGLTETSFNESGLLVYPNPTAGRFHLTVSGDAFNEKDVVIYDVMGKEVFSNTKTTASDFDIDLSKNAKGIYFVKVIREGTLSVSRVVII